MNWDITQNMTASGVAKGEGGGTLGTCFLPLSSELFFTLVYIAQNDLLPAPPPFRSRCPPPPLYISGYIPGNSKNQLRMFI